MRSYQLVINAADEDTAEELARDITGDEFDVSIDQSIAVTDQWIATVEADLDLYSISVFEGNLNRLVNDSIIVWWNKKEVL